jgi:mRNA-degrading endonuclease RelE of RelBE toxin-antitoxin system
MRFRIVWDKEAFKHLSEILDYLQTKSEDAPRIVTTAIFERLEQISQNPFLFEADGLKSPPNESFRAFVVFSYRITYEIQQETDMIRVLRVRHTSREPLGY